MLQKIAKRQRWRERKKKKEDFLKRQLFLKTKAFSRHFSSRSANVPAAVN